MTYGSSWRVPDPAFEFELPADFRRQIAGWMGNHLARPGRWRRWHRELAGGVADAGPSSFAGWVAPRLDSGTLVLDVCCGQGSDTIALARRTGRAIGLDYADEALQSARRNAAALGSSAIFHDCTLYDLRATLGRTLEAAAQPGPKALYGRLALDALGDSGRRNVLLAARTLLRGGGRSYFAVRVRRGNPFETMPRAPWAGVVPAAALREEITAHGGTVEVDQTAAGPIPLDGRRTRLGRLVVRW